MKVKVQQGREKFNSISGISVVSGAIEPGSTGDCLQYLPFGIRQNSF